MTCVLVIDCTRLEKLCSNLGECGIPCVRMVCFIDVAVFVFVLVVTNIRKFLATLFFPCNKTLWTMHSSAHNLLLEISEKKSV